MASPHLTNARPFVRIEEVTNTASNGVETMIPKYTVLRFTSVNKKTKATRPMWVETISWADGPGMKAKRVTFTYDREKAARLSSMNALSVAECFFTSVIALDWSDGTPNVELTAQLVKTQMEKLQARNEIRRKMNAEWAVLWADMVKAVPELAKLGLR